MSKLLEQINSTPKKTSKLVDFAMINPVVRLERGKEYPFLDMAEVKALTRIPELSNIKIFIGSGSKFEKGDTLFARITPCLENGKITRVLNIKGPAFGSTEFIVLRGRNGISDNEFVYYLSQTYKLRKKAEQSMIGASGRQRVDRVAFENILITYPDLPNQKKIAEILSAYDAKIENNNKIIKNLEATAQAIFNEWFINFRFPGYEKVKFVKSEIGEISEGWEIVPLINIADITMGQSPTSSHYNTRKRGLPFHQGVTYFGDRYPSDVVYSTGGEKIAEEDDILISVRAPVGRINIANTKTIIGRGLSAVRSKNKQQAFLLYLLKNLFHKEDMFGGGSVFPSITKGEFEKLKVIVPNNFIATLFDKKLSSFDLEIKNLIKENISLKSQRDQLLAKLI